MDAAAESDDVPSVMPEGDGTPIVAPGSLGAHPDRHPDDLPPPDRRRRRIPAGVIWALALALVVLTVASWMALSTDPSTNPDDVVRLTDPNLTVPAPGLGGVDMTGQAASSTPYTTFDGGSASIAGHAGVPTVVNFWASYCAPCITEMPALEQVHQEMGADVAFVGLAVTDSDPAARGLATKTGVTYELGFDPNGEIIRQFGSTNLPTTVFVAADGTIVDTHTGQIDDVLLREKIRTNFGIDPPAGP